MDISQAKVIFDQLYANIDGYQIAKESAKKLSYYYVADIYGEVLFDSFYQILKEAKPKKGEVFYDLGSGVGKPALITYLNFDFSKTIGVEKAEDLYQAAKGVLNRLEKSDKKIDFVHADFKDFDFSDGDVIFMNSYTYFYYEIYNKYFLEKLAQLKKGARIITTRMTINFPIFAVRQVGPYGFSWGDEFVYIHEKLA